MFDKPIKIRLDLEMPLPPSEKEHEEHEECELCGEVHDELDGCPEKPGFNNGPIPELFFNKPVVQSEYLERVKKLEEKQASKLKEEEMANKKKDKKKDKKRGK